MNSLKPETKYLKVQITTSERDTAKAIAKSRGMTFSGWLGQLVKHEIYEASTSGMPHTLESIQGTTSDCDFGVR